MKLTSPPHCTRVQHWVKRQSSLLLPIQGYLGIYNHFRRGNRPILVLHAPIPFIVDIPGSRKTVDESVVAWFKDVRGVYGLVHSTIQAWLRGIGGVYSLVHGTIEAWLRDVGGAYGRIHGTVETWLRDIGGGYSRVDGSVAIVQGGNTAARSSGTSNTKVLVFMMAHPGWRGSPKEQS